MAGAIFGFAVLSPFSMHLSHRIHRHIAMHDMGITDVFTSHLYGWSMPFTFLGLVVGLVTGILYVNVRRKHRQVEKSKQFLALIFDSISAGMVVVDKDFRILSANRSYSSQAGIGLTELPGRYCHDVSHHTEEPCSEHGEECPVAATFKSGRNSTSLHEHINSEGVTHIVEIESFPIRNEEGHVDSALEIIRDVTEKKNLERQIKISQKMEALGTMAGGIAHDFNNILSAIIGYAELIRVEVPADSQMKEDADQILIASDRAVKLIKRILAFSRQTEHELISVSPPPIIKETLKLLRSTMPSTVQINQEIDQECANIMAEPTMIYQILMNLCANAVHAVNENGVVEVKLFQEELGDIDLTGRAGLRPGPYMKLSVADNGTGMSAATKQQIFDPFFTTKKQGEGTGMGLAVVHGIVKSLKGFITVDSEPGKGAVFHVFIPIITGAEEGRPISRKADARTVIGTEKILFVDDEDVLSKWAGRVLGQLGYGVTIHTSSRDALEDFRLHPDEFDLVITDQTMPGLSGADLAAEILKIRPTMPVLICTGDSSKISAESIQELGIREYLLKPYEKNKLARMIRKILDGT